MVGASGFEPPTTRTPSVCATRLRYAPISLVRCAKINILERSTQISTSSKSFDNRESGEQAPQRFQVFFQLDQSGFVLLFGQRQLELVLFLFFRFFQFLARAFDRKPLGV